MDYLIPVIIISIILSLCMIITSIAILRNNIKPKPTPADTIKPIVEQLAAIHKDLVDSTGRTIDYTYINTDVPATLYLSTNGPGYYCLVIVSDTCYTEGYFTL